MGDKVTEIAKYVTQIEHKHENDRRNGYERRADDRMDKLELAQVQDHEIIVGKRGDNGLSSDVRVMKNSITRFERLLWGLGMLTTSTVVGVVVRAWPG